MIKPNIQDGVLFFILGLMTFIIGIAINNSMVYKVGMYTAGIAELFIAFLLVKWIIQHYYREIIKALKENQYKHENS